MTMTKTTRMLATGLVLVVGAVGCNNDKLTNVNQNPNNPTSSPPNPLFTQAARLSAARFLGTTFSLRQTEFVAQHWAEVFYPDEDQYKRIQGADTQGTFDASYSQEIEDLGKVIAQGQAAKNAALYGPASVLQTWDFEYLTDAWGDIPYSAALKGDSTTPNFTPKYDTQKDVYYGMFATLTKASADMSTATGTGFGAADPVYKGSLAGWQKFSNSLRARLAMRIVNVDPAKADAELKAAFAAPGGTFTSNADMAKLPWPGDGVYNNPFTDNFATRDDHRMSNTFYTVLSTYNDPRLPVFAQPTINYQKNGTGQMYAGMPNGLSQAAAGAYASTASRPGAVFFPGATSNGTMGTAANKANPQYYMTFAELEFIKAEAAERGLGGLTAGQAAGFYNAGITASMNQWGITDATAISAYLANANVAYAGGTAGLKQIALQKWIALLGDGLQSWASWRRTCVPSTIAPGPAAVLPYVPRRFAYSTTEVSVNGANVQAAITDQGPDNLGTRIWWDSKPSASPTCQ